MENDKLTFTPDELKELLTAYAQDCRREAGNAFFNQFEYVTDLHNGNYSGCVNKGLNLLSICKSVNPVAYEKIHKGSAYYWIGMGAFLSNDFQSASFFFDAAVSEDIRAGCDPIVRSTPSFKFLMIEGEKAAQAAKGLVETLQQRIEFIINDYNQRILSNARLRKFSIDQLRNTFIARSLSKENQKLRSLPTALISFALEWNYLNAFLELRVVKGTFEPFMVHLFKGCVLFESILRLNPTDDSYSHARSLISPLQGMQNQLQLPNDLPLSADDFPSVLAELPSFSTSIVDCVILTGKVRNTVGHNLGWDFSISTSEYNKIVVMILCSCMHAISCLYQ